LEKKNPRKEKKSRDGQSASTLEKIAPIPEPNAREVRPCYRKKGKPEKKISPRRAFVLGWDSRRLAETEEKNKKLRKQRKKRHPFNKPEKGVENTDYRGGKTI